MKLFEVCVHKLKEVSTKQVKSLYTLKITTHQTLIAIRPHLLHPVQFPQMKCRSIYSTFFIFARDFVSVCVFVYIYRKKEGVSELLIMYRFY